MRTFIELSVQKEMILEHTSMPSLTGCHGFDLLNSETPDPTAGIFYFSVSSVGTMLVDAQVRLIPYRYVINVIRNNNKNINNQFLLFQN